VPLLWMENEAEVAGLRLEPRASGGTWKTFGGMMGMNLWEGHGSLWSICL
jgi:hypothetical protein